MLNCFLVIRFRLFPSIFYQRSFKKGKARWQERLSQTISRRKEREAIPRQGQLWRKVLCFFPFIIYKRSQERQSLGIVRYHEKQTFSNYLKTKGKRSNPVTRAVVAKSPRGAPLIRSLHKFDVHRHLIWKHANKVFIFSLFWRHFL